MAHTRINIVFGRYRTELKPTRTTKRSSLTREKEDLSLIETKYKNERRRIARKIKSL